MSQLYVLNISELILPKLIAREKKGLADLAPGEVGLIDSETAKQKRVEIWLASGRIKKITLEEFERAYYFTQASLNQTKPELNKTYKAKPDNFQKLEDGSVTFKASVDILPEATSIPTPTVENLNGMIAINPPSNDAPLTIDDGNAQERIGDIERVRKDQLRPLKLNANGSVEEASRPQSKAVIEDTPPPKPNALLQNLSSLEALEQETPPPVIVEKTESEKAFFPNQQVQIGEVTVSAIDLAEAIHESTAPAMIVASAEARAILDTPNWKQQVKAVAQLSDIEALESVRDNTPKITVKEACDKRIHFLRKDK